MPLSGGNGLGALGRIEQPPMLEDGVAVGHAGDVVGHGAGAAVRPVDALGAQRLVAMFGRHQRDVSMNARTARCTTRGPWTSCAAPCSDGRRARAGTLQLELFARDFASLMPTSGLAWRAHLVDGARLRRARAARCVVRITSLTTWLIMRRMVSCTQPPLAEVRVAAQHLRRTGAGTAHLAQILERDQPARMPSSTSWLL